MMELSARVPVLLQDGMQATAIIDADGTVTRSGSTDRIPWWSFTKTALSIATLRLAEEGVLELDEKLPGEPFTTRQLLRHEAGLPDYNAIARYHFDVGAGKRPWPVDRLLAAVDVTRLRYDPGTGWAYSNIGYLRIAQLIERMSGQKLAAALSSLVFEPARLESARLAMDSDDLVDVQMGSASSYHPGWVYHGLIVGTVADAARLLWMLAYGGLLKPATFASMKECQTLPDYQSDIHPDPAYGLGLMLTANNPEAHPLGHGGEGPGSKIAVYAQGCRVAAVWTALPSETDADARVHEILAS
ncbi:MAG: serine hydrolase domain-containing protein [Janthinobacterium lividum]